MKIKSNEYPDEDELVNFIFTKRSEDKFSIYLLDYDLEGFMLPNEATLKKKVRNWKNIAPLNTPLIASVKEVMLGDTIIVHITMAYLDKESEEYIEFVNNNDKNKKIKSIVNTLSNLRNCSIENILEQIIYPIDKIKKDTNLYDFINENKDELYKNLTEDEVSKISKYFISNKDPYKITSKFKIISLGGVNNTKDIIKRSLEKFKYDVNIKLNCVPNFEMISNSVEVTNENHKEIIDEMIKIGKTKDPKSLVSYL